MNQDIHTHLEKLKIELNKLEPAVKHLQKVDENATALVSAFSNVNKEYSKHLQAIEKLLVDSNKGHHKQISKDVQDSTVKLNDLGEKITMSFKNVEKEVLDLLDEYKFLSSETDKLVIKIDNINFPVYFDSLNSKINLINQELQITKKRLADIERNIKNDLTPQIKELTSRIESSDKSTKSRIELAENLIIQKIVNSENRITELMKKNSNENKQLRLLLFISIGLTTGLIIYNLLS